MAGKFIGKDVEYILQVFIETMIREGWTSEFFNFYNISTLLVKEVIAGNYSREDLPQNIDKQFAYVSALLFTNEGQVHAYREFIKKYCDAKYLYLYDICWGSSDERRRNFIKELQKIDCSKFCEKMAMSWTEGKKSR